MPVGGAMTVRLWPSVIPSHESTWNNGAGFHPGYHCTSYAQRWTKPRRFTHSRQHFSCLPPFDSAQDRLSRECSFLCDAPLTMKAATLRHSGRACPVPCYGGRRPRPGIQFFLDSGFRRNDDPGGCEGSKPCLGTPFFKGMTPRVSPQEKNLPFKDTTGEVPATTSTRR
jgi:hypothetical protein